MEATQVLRFTSQGFEQQAAQQQEQLLIHQVQQQHSGADSTATNRWDREAVTARAVEYERIR